MPRWSPVSATPNPELVTLAEAKLHLRIDHAEEDALIATLIAAASGQLDGPSAVLGRAGLRRVWRCTIGSEEARANLLPCIRLLGDIELVGLDVFTSGAWQAVPVGDCRLQRSAFGFFVHPAPGATWPTPDQHVADLYRVSVETGFSDDEAGKLSILKAAALVLIGHLYVYREGNGPDMLQGGIFQSLLAPIRDAW